MANLEQIRGIVKKEERRNEGIKINKLLNPRSRILKN
jgi:hypothetical protein